VREASARNEQGRCEQIGEGGIDEAELQRGQARERSDETEQAEGVVEGERWGCGGREASVGCERRREEASERTRARSRARGCLSFLYNPASTNSDSGRYTHISLLFTYLTSKDLLLSKATVSQLFHCQAFSPRGDLGSRRDGLGCSGCDFPV
jgi:hypothetical protein